jgi:hypothetical protein
MQISERYFSFLATIAKPDGQRFLDTALIRTSIPLRARADRWWGRFKAPRSTVEAVQEGETLLIRMPGGLELPAVVVSREPDEIAFRCRACLPDGLRIENRPSPKVMGGLQSAH